MERNIVRLEITNSRNDDTRVEWFFGESDEQAEEWVKEKRKEKDKWNYDTAGAISYRYYEFEHYNFDTFLDVDITHLQGITVKDLIKIINDAN